MVLTGKSINNFTIVTISILVTVLVLSNNPSFEAFATSNILLTVFASPPGGTYNSTQTVTLAASRTPSTIFYTTDGTTPTTSSPSGPSPVKLTISTTSTLKFFAKDSFGNTSPTAAANYTITTSFINSLTPIKHVVFIIQENHSFDNYFGTFPNLLPQYAVNQNVCLQVSKYNQTLGCVHPWNADSKANAIMSLDPSHTARASQMAIDGGKMDGFVSFNFDAGITNFTTKDYPVAYFTNNTLPNYWDYAQYYALDANFFSSMLGPSYPNHLYLVAGQSGGIIYNTPVFNLTFNNIANVMSESKVDWKYYSGNWNPKINCVSPINGTYLDKLHFTSLARFWNVLIDFPVIQKNSVSCHDLLRTSDFFSNVTSGYLPQVSWIIPGGAYSSEHPCNSSACKNSLVLGQDYVSALVNAIASNKTLYSSTAIFITWDDFGGYYDHVVPKTVDGYGYSLRVPLIVISPYVQRGITYGLGGQQTDFTAFLKTIESNWNLPSLTSRDNNTYSLMYMFNFTQPPIAPLLMPSGQLGEYPWESCVAKGLCHIGTSGFTAKDLLKLISSSTGSNDED